jgi:hypothetical protein
MKQLPLLATRLPLMKELPVLTTRLPLRLLVVRLPLPP